MPTLHAGRLRAHSISSTITLVAALVLLVPAMASARPAPQAQMSQFSESIQGAVENVLPSVDRVGTIIFLDWDPMTDQRVKNFRVYRRSTRSMEEFSVGFTPVNGFADLNIVSGEEYEYRVTSVSAGLLESEPTEWIKVAAVRFKGEGIFANGFEPQAQR